MSKIAIDPITRIEGHLRIEAEVDQGQVSDAWSSVTMWRGIETILQGRDPREAWTLAQRICGVCTGVHALASVRAVEDTLGIEAPKNAVYLRNIMHAVQHIHDHVVHFYHLHALDWVDLVDSLQADATETAKLAAHVSDWPKNSATYFKGIQDRIQAFVDRGRLGPFGNAYWGHSAYQLSPELNLIGVAHYLEALEWQRNVVKIHAIIGGKNPHPQTFVVGGMASPINPNSHAALNAERLSLIQQQLKQTVTFIEQVYIPDLLAIANEYKNWASIGNSGGNYLCYGDFPMGVGNPNTDPSLLFMPRGYILDGDLSQIHPVDHEKVTEYVAHSWFDYEGGKKEALHPWKGETTPNYSGPKPPYDYLNTGEEDSYSWLKTPRYDDHPMEVGPLARMLVSYADTSAACHESVKTKVDTVLDYLGVGTDALFSTLGRTAARGIETWVQIEFALSEMEKLINNINTGDYSIHSGEKWDPSSWPDDAVGVGMIEAPRGALGHWVHVKDKTIHNYQCVVPSTWNGSPRDPQGQRSPFESSLLDTPIDDEQQPLEILRTIHSFDPCMACASHLFDADGNEIVSVKVV